MRIFSQRGSEEGEASPSFALGPLELSVMEVVWQTGTCNVRDVVRSWTASSPTPP